MNRTADNLIDVTWVAWATERLREQWPRADSVTLAETARELWREDELRICGPRQAVEKWLSQGMPACSSTVTPPSSTVTPQFNHDTVVQR